MRITRYFVELIFMSSAFFPSKILSQSNHDSHAHKIDELQIFYSKCNNPARMQRSQVGVRILNLPNYLTIYISMQYADYLRVFIS